MSEGRGVRQSIYLKDKEGIDEVAFEEHEKLNGILIEDMFWDTHLGKEKNMQEILKGMYRGEYNLQGAIEKLLIYFSSNEKFAGQAFQSLIKIIKMVCGNSRWIDDDSSTRKKEMQCLYDILKKKELELSRVVYGYSNDIDTAEIAEIRERVSAAEKSGDEINGFDVNILEVVDLEDKLKKMIESEDTLPGDFLDFMSCTWEGFYFESSEVYVPVLYCVKYSSNIIDNPHLRQRLRRFCLYLSDIICAEDSCKKIEGV